MHQIASPFSSDIKIVLQWLVLLITLPVSSFQDQFDPILRIKFIAIYVTDIYERLHTSLDQNKFTNIAMLQTHSMTNDKILNILPK